MPRKELLGEKGFTLIELMVTVAITLLALVGYVGANLVLQQTTSDTFERTVALQDANRVIEQMRNNASSGNFPGSVTAAYPNNGTVAGFNSLTNELVTVSYTDATADPLTVTVNVRWLQGGRRTVNASLRTLITQRT